MAAGSLLLELTLLGPLTLNQAIIGWSSAAVPLRLSAPCTRRGVKRTLSPPAEHYIQQTPRFMLQKKAYFLIWKKGSLICHIGGARESFTGYRIMKQIANHANLE